MGTRTSRFWRNLGALSLISTAVTGCIGGGSDDRCKIYANNPHKSTHQPGRINAVGQVQCSYVPAVGPDLEVRILKRASNGSWVAQSTSTVVLAAGDDYVEISESMPCKSGTYMAEARAYSSGPKGQPAVWSLWAFGYTTTISCGS